MIWTHRFMVIAAADFALADSLTSNIAGESGSGMWTIRLSETGAEPATHLASHGLIQQQFADMLQSPQAIYDAATAFGLPVTLAQVEGLLARADISADWWTDGCARMGLQVVRGDIQ